MNPQLTKNLWNKKPCVFKSIWIKELLPFFLKISILGQNERHAAPKKNLLSPITVQNYVVTGKQYQIFTYNIVSNKPWKYLSLQKLIACEFHLCLCCCNVCRIFFPQFLRILHRKHAKRQIKSKKNEWLTVSLV